MNNEPVRCALCGGVDFREVVPGGRGARVLRCGGCGLVRTIFPTGKAPSAGHYDKDYYAPWLGEQSAAREKIWNRRLKSIERFVPAGRIFDVGCGDGMFLEVAAKAGWETEGSDISEWAAQYARENRRLRVRAGELQNMDLPSDYYDAVTMWHVLEHVASPLVLLEKVRGMLKTGGLAVAAVPNASAIIYRAVYRIFKFRSSLSVVDREPHIHHFDPSTLRMIFDKAGFRVTEIIPDAGYAGALRKTLDAFPVALAAVSGINISTAIEIRAIKK